MSGRLALLAVLVVESPVPAAPPEISVEVKDPAFKGLPLPALKKEVIAKKIGVSFPDDKPPVAAFGDESVGR